MSEFEDQDPTNEEPVDKLPPRPFGAFSGKKFIAGSKRSQRRLATLNFDPIQKLVKLYERLEQEDEYYCNLRQVGKVTELDKKGDVKKSHKYSGVAHATVFANMSKIGNDLLRYAYGRVPETLNLNTQPTRPMVIKLTDTKSLEHKKSSTLIINGRSEEVEDVDLEDYG